MATLGTTTLRVPIELRDEIARIAEHRGSSMVEVVAQAVDRLSREEWWNTVHLALADTSSADLEAYQAEVAGLDGAIGDGLYGN